MSTTILSCHRCGANLTLDALLVNADDRAVVMELLSNGTPLGAAMARYISLFAPPKTSLTLRKQIRLAKELMHDIKRAAINHRGREWAVPVKLWEQGIDQMLQARDAGKLDLPMANHRYLYAILSSLADKTEAVAEAQTEASRRTPGTHTPAATYQVHGQTLPMGQALATVFGGQCAALAKLDAERGSAAPMPDAVRQQLAALKKPMTPNQP